MGQSSDTGESRYTGEMGRTRTGETTVWCPGCGAWFGARWFRGIDAAADPALVSALVEQGFAGINETDCPRCERPYVIEEAVVVHRAGALLLVMPLRRLHRAQQARGALIAAVADAPGAAPPAYARDPVLLAGVAGLKAALDGVDATRVDATRVDAADARSDDGRGEGDDPRQGAEPHERHCGDDGGGGAYGGDDAPSDDAGEDRSIDGSAPDDSEDRSIDDGFSTAVHVIEAPPAFADDPPRPAEVAAPEAPGAAELPAPTASAPASTPPTGGLLAALIDGPGEAGADGGWDEPAEAPTDWRDGWSLDAPVEQEPTRVAPRPRGLRPGVDRMLLVEGEAVTARLRVSEADALLDPRTTLRFQLHETAVGPACCLALVPADGAPAVWPIDDDEVRAQLARRFMVQVELFDDDGALIGERRFDPPLARNVAIATARAEALGGETDAARAALVAGELDLRGELRHNFGEASFSALRTVADAHLALGIVGFWSTTDRLRYLLLVQSFPAVWFDAIVRRVLRAALGFGLLPPPHLERWAIEHGLAVDPPRLLRRALAGFAELSLGIAGTPDTLDPLDTWENWERLLTRAEALEVAVGPEIEALALRAMEAARAAAGVEDASDEAIELDLEDAIELDSVDLSIDESANAEPAVDPIEAGLADRGDAVLLGLLDGPERRVAAARVMLRRGEAIYAPALADAILTLSADELRRVLPAGQGLASTLAPHLREAARDADPERRGLLMAFVDAGDRAGDIG